MKIDQDLKTGEQFFKDRDSLYDAMPAVWKNMPEENRRAAFDAIKSFYGDSNVGDGGVWNERNMRQLVKYVAIDELPALQASFFVAKEDPSVFKTPVCVVPPPSSAVSSSRIDEFFGLQLETTSVTTAIQYKQI